jgi:hypothetical protein
MTDQVNLYGKFGIESIPNAILYFQADFAKTVEASIDKDFDIFRRPNNEDYLLIGFGLDFAYERIFFNINYNLPMWGRNNWKTSIFNLTAGFSL